MWRDSFYWFNDILETALSILSLITVFNVVKLSDIEENTPILITENILASACE